MIRAAHSSADQVIPHLRRRSRGLVRRVRRYYEAIRLPTLVHLRRTTSCSLSGPPSDQPTGRVWDLPVLALEGFHLLLQAGLSPALSADLEPSAPTASPHQISRALQPGPTPPGHRPPGAGTPARACDQIAICPGSGARRCARRPHPRVPPRGVTNQSVAVTGNLVRMFVRWHPSRAQHQHQHTARVCIGLCGSDRVGRHVIWSPWLPGGWPRYRSASVEPDGTEPASTRPGGRADGFATAGGQWLP